MEVNPEQLKKIGSELLVMAFYKELGYEVEKNKSNHRIDSNHEKIIKILPEYSNLIKSRELGERGMPDLIVYKTAMDWFFVEVKAYNDTVRLIQLEWYKNHPKYPIHICVVLPNESSKNIYIAKEKYIPCKHSFDELYQMKNGETCFEKDLKVEHRNGVNYINAHLIGYKCKKCGYYIDYNKI